MPKMNSFIAVFFLVLTSLSASAHAVAPGLGLGMDRLDAPAVKNILKGKRWALLSHPASRNARGDHLSDILFNRQAELGIQLVSFFAPEHGFRGDQDVAVPDSTDPRTGLPIYSLYGPRLAPTPEELSPVDGVIIDLQDVGVRYYTFSTTMALVMKACRDAGKKVVVLDRPNPIGGESWEGAILEGALQGGIANYYPIPTVHGMTMGELALLFNTAFEIHAELTVVPMENYGRGLQWRETGLPWIPPSPALTTPEQAELYSFFGTFEALNLAVGRGKTNERAFRIFGAPWITSAESVELVRRLNALGLPGLHFKPVAWTPSRSVYEGRLSHGFEVEMGKFREVAGLRSFLKVLTTMRGMFGARLDLSDMDRMAGQRWIRQAIEAGSRWEPILERIQRESAVFSTLREGALLY